MRGSGELGVQYFEDQYKTLRGADALALLTEWDIYKQPDFAHCELLAIPMSSTDGTSTPHATAGTKGFVLLVGRPQPPR